MKHEPIDARPRNWILSRGPDGKLHAEIGAAAPSAADLSDPLLQLARIHVAETRLW